MKKRRAQPCTGSRAVLSFCAMTCSKARQLSHPLANLGDFSNIASTQRICQRGHAVVDHAVNPAKIYGFAPCAKFDGGFAIER